jgi:hypothetical protein
VASLDGPIVFNECTHNPASCSLAPNSAGLHTRRRADELVEGFLEQQSLASIAGEPVREAPIRPLV